MFPSIDPDTSFFPSGEKAILSSCSSVPTLDIGSRVSGLYRNNPLLPATAKFPAFGEKAI
jgi:hypothetical protein